MKHLANLFRFLKLFLGVGLVASLCHGAVALGAEVMVCLLSCEAMEGWNACSHRNGLIYFIYSKSDAKNWSFI